MISKAVLKSIKALKLKKYRTKERKFLVEGIKSINELIRAEWEIDYIFTTSASESSVLPHRTKQTIDNKTLQSVTQLVTNEDCLAIVRMPETPSEQAIKIDGAVVALDGVQDPGNLGTMIRTLDWFGYRQIICSTDTVDFYNLKTISATMGSFTRVSPYYVDLVAFIETSGLPAFGLDMNGDDISTAKLTSPGIYVLGNESNGLRQQVKDRLTATLSIRGTGGAESLNVGVSAGILLHQLAKP